MGYNNSDHYGKAVLHYAALLKQNPVRYRSLHQWQIHYASSAGDLWLNEGYASDHPIAVNTYLEQHPHSAPPNPVTAISMDRPSTKRCASLCHLRFRIQD